MADAKNYLSLGRKAGRLETGEETCAASVKMGRARLLILASDASENARRRAEGFLYRKQTPHLTAPYTKQELSDATGRAGCSMVVFTDVGLAVSFVKALEAQTPGAYAETLESLEKKKERADRRARERNKKTGKRRTIE